MRIYGIYFLTCQMSKVSKAGASCKGTDKKKRYDAALQCPSHTYLSAL